MAAQKCVTKLVRKSIIKAAVKMIWLAAFLWLIWWCMFTGEPGACADRV